VNDVKVLVTGGAGYLGWSVISALADMSGIAEIVIYDNFMRQNYGLLLKSRQEMRKKCIVRVDDILNSRGLEKALEGAECICHLAALAPSPYSDDHPHAFDQVNHWGTAEVAYAAERAKVKRFVYVSSGAIYGFGRDFFTPQSSPMPVSAYGASKLAGENQVRRLSDKMEVVIIRAGTLFGLNPVARFDTFVNKFVLNMSLGMPIQIHGSGDQRRPLVHVDQLARLVVAGVIGELEPDIYNAVHQNKSVNEVVEIARTILPKLNTIFINQQQRMRDIVMQPDSRFRSFMDKNETVEEALGAMLSQIAMRI